jgi:hypothetical protein
MGDAVKTTVGLCRLDRRDLLQRRAGGRRMRVRVTGVLILAGDIDPVLAAESIESIDLRGPLMASASVRRALAGRITTR